MRKVSQLPPQAPAFLIAMRERFKFCKYDAAKLFNVKADLIAYHIRNTRPNVQYSVGISSLRYCWKHWLRYGKIPDACMIYKPDQEDPKRHATTALRWWLDDLLGWHSLAYIAAKLHWTRRQLKSLLKRLDKTDPDKLWPRVYLYTIPSLSRLILKESGYYMPVDQIRQLCRKGILRWYKDARAMIVKPNDAEWVIENWKPGIKVPRHPGGVRWG